MSFYDELNASPWKGVIAEVGIGLEFSSRYLRVPGASQTIIQVICDYAGLDRSPDTRAVSLENAKHMAYRARRIAAKTGTPKSFGLAITGAHYEDKPSHGWIFLAYNHGDAYLHFSIPDKVSREGAGEVVDQLSKWLITSCLLSTISWTEKIRMVDHYNIDVLYAPGVSDYERLLLLKPHNPLFYQDGKFNRVVDGVRACKTIYPGAFNPPTKNHLEMEDCLFEISQVHFYKGAISLEDIVHRLRMFDTHKRPVLVTQAPRFIDKHRTLSHHGIENIVFIMGSDAWNIFTEPTQYPYPDYLCKILSKTSFEVRPRQGIPIQENEVTKNLSWYQLVMPETEGGSTDVRNASVPHKSPLLTPNVAKYIKEQGLYT